MRISPCSFLMVMPSWILSAWYLCGLCCVLSCIFGALSCALGNWEDGFKICVETHNNVDVIRIADTTVSDLPMNRSRLESNNYLCSCPRGTGYCRSCPQDECCPSVHLFTLTRLLRYSTSVGPMRRGRVTTPHAVPGCHRLGLLGMECGRGCMCM